MTGLVFEQGSPIVASAPNRADIACFVGLVHRRASRIPAGVYGWLREQGWRRSLGSDTTTDELLNVPVPIDDWDVFDLLFAWEQRVFAQKADGQEIVGSSYLGAAVRSYFAQGGRKCYVVRVGDPLAVSTGRSQKLLQLAQLIPGYPVRVDVSPVDRQTWRGIGHLFGLPDVSFLCLPDLPDLVSADITPVDPTRKPPKTPEIFVPCSAPLPEPGDDRVGQRVQAPRCDEAGYDHWVASLRLVADWVSRQQREVQLVAAIPMPQVGTAADADLFQFLLDQGTLSKRLDRSLVGLSSAFVQLVYPWVQTPGSIRLPGQVESPDAVLVGVLARSALSRGAFRSVANLHLADVYATFPSLSQFQMRVEYLDNPEESFGTRQLLERVSMMGQTPDGWRVLSDVTTSLEESYRPASVNRLVSVIVRAARRLGEEVLFEPSGDRLWVQLRDQLETLLLTLLQSGALRGDTPEDAFLVRCDRSTMTRFDLDNGRLIAEIQFTPAAPIEQITIVLAMDEGGQVSLISR